MQPYASSTQNAKALEDQNGHYEAEASSEKYVQNHEETLTKAQILVEIDGKITGKYQLSKTIFTIGRYLSSDIQIPLARVSRLHATIRWQNGAWVIQDAESLNGLTFQGERIDQLALVDGDVVSIGPTIMLHYEELKQ